jgi:hypothetical protein
MHTRRRRASTNLCVVKSIVSSDTARRRSAHLFGGILKVVRRARNGTTTSTMQATSRAARPLGHGFSLCPSMHGSLDRWIDQIRGLFCVTLLRSRSYLQCLHVWVQLAWGGHVWLRSCPDRHAGYYSICPALLALLGCSSHDQATRHVWSTCP